MRYDILQTGSDGNCTIIDGMIAIDMGVSQKVIEPYIPDLKLVLLTHEHGDHFLASTVKALAKARPTLVWACGEWMVPHLLEVGVRPQNIHPLPMNEWSSYGEPVNLMVCPFETHHNVRNCGWLLWRGKMDNLFYATDLGDLDGIEAKGYRTYLLEANHTRAEIEAAVAEAQETGEYTYRIKAAENHLSYEQAVEWLLENQASWSTWVPMHEHKERGRAGDGREADDLQQDYGP